MFTTELSGEATETGGGPDHERMMNQSFLSRSCVVSPQEERTVMQGPITVSITLVHVIKLYNQRWRPS